MPAPEIVLRFPGPTQVSVSFDGTDSGLLPFTNPVTGQDRKDISWYVETYGAHSLADPDDTEARRIEARLLKIGKALFDAVFGGDNRAAERIFNRFQDADSEHRVLTIDTQSAAILSLPWELLHDPTGVFLFRERPHISVRRCISGTTGGRSPFAVASKGVLHLLFVISRPTDAGFIDPRADAGAVIDALEQHANGRVTWEVLRPATLNALTERLDDDTKPPVDILHFDGHGVFAQVSEQEAEQDPNNFGKSIQSEIQRERLARGAPGTKTSVGIGFLLFEKDDGSGHLISAQDLADNLFRAKVGLVILSACQSAAQDTEGDPMASVAGRLTTTGIPAILAMTHAVLAVTTCALFGRFYQSLARGKGIATALDDARALLANNPEKFQVQRGNRRQTLKLDDWFLPALFHAGGDVPLLTRDGDARQHSGFWNTDLVHNLRPAHEASFFGRRWELWNIERWLAADTRRISITGFGGQGKTELALEAGRWLLRTGLFQRAVFIDYAHVQSDDPLDMAVSTIGTVLGQTLEDAAGANLALASAPTLVILDNLETVSPVGLASLLDAAAAWSERGQTRLLLTSRPDLGYPAYRIEGTRLHRRIALEGLGSAAYPDDALDWYAALSSLPMADDSQAVPPPKREELIALFDQVAFHPLSIAVLAQQLRTRTAKELGARLTALLDDQAVSSIAQEGTPEGLVASLRLSLDQLSPEQRQAARRLGVFQGGAMEDSLLAITGLGAWRQDDSERKQLQALIEALDGGDPRALPAKMSANLPEGAEQATEPPNDLLDQLWDSPDLQGQLQVLRDRLAALPAPSTNGGPVTGPWPALRRQLEASALIEAERIPGVDHPFLRFHPTFAPLLWDRLDGEEQAALTHAHRLSYCQLAYYLYKLDTQRPDQARAIARRELPNLLQAVDQALATGDKDAVGFIGWVNWFLKYFGRTREAAVLTRQATQVGGTAGSHAWYLAHFSHGEQLLETGQATKAAECFEAILRAFGETPSYELVIALGGLGRCYEARGRPDLAEAQFRLGIEVTQALKNDYMLNGESGVLQKNLGDALFNQGRFGEARVAYEDALNLMREVGNLRSVGTIQAAIGNLFLQEQNLEEAKLRYEEALALFQWLGEPISEAIAHQHLGNVFLAAHRWEQAEWHYRESARLHEKHGNLAASAWGSLAIVFHQSGRSEAAETWYRKTIEAMKMSGNTVGVSMHLYNFAKLLQHQPGRRDEARHLAEDSLAIKQTLDPGVAKIWTTYDILYEIAAQQSRPEEATEYNRLARESKRRFAGTAYELQRFALVAADVVEAVAGNPMAIARTEHLVWMTDHAGGGAADFAHVVKRILAGERDPDALCQNLSFQFAPKVEIILQALADPSVLETLLSEAGYTE